MVWSSAKTSEWFLRCQGTNSPCFSNIERIFCLRSSSVYFLCSRTQTWHLEEWWLLCQERTLRKICLNPRPQMLSNYSTLLSRMSCFILGLSRGSSVVAGWAALVRCATRVESRKAVVWDVSATCWPAGSADKLPDSTGRTTAEESVHPREDTGSLSGT